MNSSTRPGEDELTEATDQVPQASGSLIFVRGKLKSGERLLLSFSGTIKRLKQNSARNAVMSRDPAMSLLGPHWMLFR